MRDIATLEPVTCGHGDDLGQAITLLGRHRVQHVPVLDEGEAVGVISLADIVFALPGEHRGALDQPDQR
jgi:CBS domain-containing protein